MQMFLMDVRGYRTTVLAADRKAAVKIAENSYRAANGLPSSHTILASVVDEGIVVPVTKGLVGVK